VYHLIATDQVRASTSAAIKSLVSIDLPGGTPSFAEVASMLYMSESSLRRRLQGEHTSYQAIKDEVRCEVAIDKLLNENARVADLAELLGFTEASSFVRSFKSWTGHTPRSYRDRMQVLGRV
jgi:AraC-like DNA-binding protein